MRRLPAAARQSRRNSRGQTTGTNVVLNDAGDRTMAEAGCEGRLALLPNLPLLPATPEAGRGQLRETDDRLHLHLVPRARREGGLHLGKPTRGASRSSPV